MTEQSVNGRLIELLLSSNFELESLLAAGRLQVEL